MPSRPIRPTSLPLLAPSAWATMQAKPCSTKNTCSMRLPASCGSWPLTQRTRVSNGRSRAISAGGKADSSSLLQVSGAWKFTTHALLTRGGSTKHLSAACAQESRQAVNVRYMTLLCLTPAILDQQCHGMEFQSGLWLRSEGATALRWRVLRSASAPTAVEATFSIGSGACAPVPTILVAHNRPFCIAAGQHDHLRAYAAPALM